MSVSTRNWDQPDIPNDFPPILALNQPPGLSDKHVTAKVQTTRKQNKQGPNVNWVYFELQITKDMGENQKVSHLDLLHRSLLQQVTKTWPVNTEITPPHFKGNNCVEITSLNPLFPHKGIRTIFFWLLSSYCRVSYSFSSSQNEPGFPSLLMHTPTSMRLQNSLQRLLFKGLDGNTSTPGSAAEQWEPVPFYLKY